jgi:hypothetical protein
MQSSVGALAEGLAQRHSLTALDDAAVILTVALHGRTDR